MDQHWFTSLLDPEDYFTPGTSKERNQQRSPQKHTYVAKLWYIDKVLTTVASFLGIPTRRFFSGAPLHK